MKTDAPKLVRRMPAARWAAGIRLQSLVKICAVMQHSAVLKLEIKV